MPRSTSHLLWRRLTVSERTRSFVVHVFSPAPSVCGAGFLGWLWRSISSLARQFLLSCFALVSLALFVQQNSDSLTTSHQSSTPIAMIHGPLFQRNANTPTLSVASLCSWLHHSRNCNRSQRLTSKWNGRLLVMSADCAVPMYCWDRRAPAVGPNRSLRRRANSSSPPLPLRLELHGTPKTRLVTADLSTPYRELVSIQAF